MSTSSVDPQEMRAAVAAVLPWSDPPRPALAKAVRTWLELATGSLKWTDALAAGRITASGNRADLSALLPLVRL